jgi:branched-chain amino acid transport system substrate-binding protein
MNTKRIFFITSLALLCLGGAMVSAQTTSAETVTVGFIGMSGGAQGNRDQALYQAALLASEELNADDDRLTDPDGTRYALEVVYYQADTESEATDALASAIDDDAIAVLGPQELEFAQAIADNGTLAVAVLLGAPDSPTGTDMYRLVSSYTQQATDVASYLVTERNFSKVGVIGANTDVAQDNLQAFRDSVDADVIVTDLTHTADEEDFSSDARTIRENDTEALYVSTLDAQMLALLTALNDIGWQGVIVYDGLDSDFVNKANDGLASGVYGISNWSSNAYDSASQAFVSDYVARWNTTPSDQAIAYYDAMYLLAQAIENNGATVSDIKTALNTDTYRGVQGDYDGGDINASLLLQVNSNNQIVEAARYRATICVTCTDTWWADNTTTDTTASATFNISLIASTDGINEADGIAIENATKLAIREINDQGGVIGADGTRYTLALTTYNATNGNESAQAFSQATQNGAQIVLGPDANAQVLNNLYGAQGANALQWVSATNTQITANEPANAVFQLRANDDANVQAVASYLLDERNYTRFATVAVRTEYGLDASEAFADAVNNSDDGQLVASFEHDVDATDMSAIAQQIVDNNLEAIAMWTAEPAFVTLWDALNALNWQGVISYGYATPALTNNLTVSTNVELLAPMSWSILANDWLSQDFVTRYAERYGTTPTTQSAAYYDAVYLLANALQDGGTTAEEMQTYVLGLDSFIGVQGIYAPSIFANGELTRSVQLVSVINGTMSEVARYNSTTCWAGCQ